MYNRNVHPYSYILRLIRHEEEKEAKTHTPPGTHMLRAQWRAGWKFS